MKLQFELRNRIWLIEKLCMMIKLRTYDEMQQKIEQTLWLHYQFDADSSTSLNKHVMQKKGVGIIHFHASKMCSLWLCCKESRHCKRLEYRCTWRRWSEWCASFHALRFFFAYQTNIGKGIMNSSTFPHTCKQPHCNDLLFCVANCNAFYFKNGQLTASSTNLFRNFRCVFSRCRWIFIKWVSKGTVTTDLFWGWMGERNINLLVKPILRHRPANTKSIYYTPIRSPCTVICRRITHASKIIINKWCDDVTL